MPKKVVFILILITLVLGATATFYLLKQATSVKNNTAPTTVEWKKYSFDKIGLSFSAPNDMVVAEGISDSNIFTFSIQRDVYPNPNYYQLYAALQPTSNMGADAEGLQNQLVEGSRDTVIGGYQAVQGQYKGERNRYVTFIFTDNGILTLATSQPTPENEQTTNSILDTFSFKRDGEKSFVNPTTESAVQDLLAKKYNKQIEDVSIKVTKEVPGFASGSVTFGQGGVGESGMWIALLGNGWQVVWDGNGNVDCNKMRDDFGVPDAILKPNFCD
jgi:hypothetical protein